MSLRRVRQAQCLFEHGFGQALGIESFHAYLADTPEVPDSLRAEDPELPFLSLADLRLPPEEIRRLLGITLHESYAPDPVQHCDARHYIPPEMFWFRHDDGSNSRGRKAGVVRAECRGNILAGTALVGMMAHAHHGIVKCGHAVRLPGSMLRGSTELCATLFEWLGRIQLYAHVSLDEPSSTAGTMRFRMQ